MLKNNDKQNIEANINALNKYISNGSASRNKSAPKEFKKLLRQNNYAIIQPVLKNKMKNRPKIIFKYRKPNKQTESNVSQAD